MRITGANTITRSDAHSARRASAGGFAVPDGEAPRAAGPVATLRTVGGIDALVALQGVEDIAERRRRAVRRGQSALDILDELKAGLLTGALEPPLLHRMKAMAADLQEGTGDAGLDGVLAEIELRVAVELAKLSQR